MKAWPLQFYWKLGPIFTPLKSELKSILPILTLELKSVKWGMFQNSGSLKTVGFLLKSTISIGFGGSLILKHNGIDANKCMYKLFGKTGMFTRFCCCTSPVLVQLRFLYFSLRTPSRCKPRKYLTMFPCSACRLCNIQSQQRCKCSFLHL